LQGLGKKLPGESGEIETSTGIRRESEKIIVRAGSLAFGLIGFTIFMIAHWLCDFLWLYFLSALSFNCIFPFFKL